VPPFRLQRLDHIVLRVRDLPHMVAFYVEVLGCHVEKQTPAGGLTQLRAGEALIDLVEVGSKLDGAGGKGPGVDGRNLDHLCLTIEPFDDRLLRDWLSVRAGWMSDTEERYGAEGEGPSLYIRDPEGNGIELKKRLVAAAC
jgi:glyoxylase I family protein